MVRADWNAVSRLRKRGSFLPAYGLKAQQEVAEMRMDPLPHEVRDLVLQTLQDFGLPVFGPMDLDETVLVDEGRYVARTYKADGYMAMWLLAIGIVQFYDADGNMLLTVNLLEEMEPQRMAA
jgi:hypothetical protein